ncbi:hypothetical protein MKX01_027458 [Papaver californicum]|nr:hypothetical protein MKX01_027458 [Papaver californicum]
MFLASGVANTTWASPNGDFAFGFHPIADNSFLLAIWYAKIPDQTVVWFATDSTEYNGGIQIPRGSKVELTTDGKLILSDPQGKLIWSAGDNLSGATYAAMLDDGNFVLESTSSAGYLWESFNHPTDTILPSQILDRVSRMNNKLYSRANDTSFSNGRFRLRIPNDNNFVLYPVAFPSLTENRYQPYYNLTSLTGSNPDIKQFVFNESGQIYIISNNGSIVNLIQWGTLVPDTNLYYRATLDFDGVFTQYSHPKNTSAPGHFDDRLGSGACGYNSYCILTSEGRPSCQCPPEFGLINPNNRFGGCTPNFDLQGCREEDTRKSNESFELRALKNVDWMTSDYEELQNYNEQDCRSSCLSDCLCAVALFRLGTCWKKKLPLPNGRLDISVNGNALIKIRKDNGSSSEPDPHSPDFDRRRNPHSPDFDRRRNRSTLILVGSLLLGCSFFFNLLFLAVIFVVLFFMDKRLRKKTHKTNVLRSNLHSFTYQELEEATDGFAEELGRGAFGTVYKGFTEEMGSIAVKKLDKVFQQGEKEFKSEVNTIGQTHHKNLVRLLGFCDEGQHRLLVYEFMSNSSLAHHLFGISKPDWNRRVQIAFGISRELMYLHEECSTQIIHCNIKPQNILLDDSFTARISDFGLAKLLITSHTRASTGIRGTRGYVAPEWFRNTPVSSKVDVYSFGVMLLEIICCRKGVVPELVEEEIKAILIGHTIASAKGN